MKRKFVETIIKLYKKSINIKKALQKNPFSYNIKKKVVK